MPNFAKQIAGHGRFGDTLVAHLTKAQANTLKKAGGAGTINPTTGLLEFYKGTLGNQGQSEGNAFTSAFTKADGGQRTVADVFKNISKIQKDNAPKKADQKDSVSKQALAVAHILNYTVPVYNDAHNMNSYVYMGQEGKGPLHQDTINELDGKLGEIGQVFRRGVVSIDNEDMASRDMSIFLRAIGPGGRSGNLKRGVPLIPQEELMRAYDAIGVKPYGPDAKMGERSFQMEGYNTYKTIGNTPLSLATQQVTKQNANYMANLLANNDVRQFKSSANSDGTGGASGISDGGLHGLGISIGGDPSHPSSFANVQNQISREMGFVGMMNSVPAAIAYAYNNPDGVPLRGDMAKDPITGEIANLADESLLGDMGVSYQSFHNALNAHNYAGYGDFGGRGSSGGVGGFGSKAMGGDGRHGGV